MHVVEISISAIWLMGKSIQGFFFSLKTHGGWDQGKKTYWVCFEFPHLLYVEDVFCARADKMDKSGLLKGKERRAVRRKGKRERAREGEREKGLLTQQEPSAKAGVRQGASVCVCVCVA